jgi:hypothetical protein
MEPPKRKKSPKKKKPPEKMKAKKPPAADVIDDKYGNNKTRVLVAEVYHSKPNSAAAKA